MDLSRLCGGVLRYGGATADRDPIRFAADDLTAYLRRVFGVEPSCRPSPWSVAEAWLHLAPAAPSERPPAALALPPGAEAVVHPDGDGVTIAATSPRALVSATYAFLEALGCRWSPYGAGDEHVPRPGELPPRIPELTLRPAFARRAYAADLATWHYTVPARLAERLPGDLAFVDWLAKSGATGLFFIRHANDIQWAMPELLPELRRRGLGLEVGGHALPALLPRTLFAAHPEYFPVGPDGHRTDLGNVCPSSAAALAVISAGARAARETIAEAAEFHLWGLDLLGGGWCRCAGCARLTPSDQALTVTNRVASELPGRLFHLAYHDTLPPPRRVRPHPNVWAEFAPRERCYGHALDDPACRTNGAYRAALAGHLDLFAGRVHVFEYYGDAILFGGCAVPLVEVIARDLAHYRRAGVSGISCLTFGQYSLWAYGVNIAAFAHAACDPITATRGATQHCERTYGARAEPMARYLAALERLMADVVTYGDLLLPPRRPGEVARVRDALSTARTAASTVRELLRAAVGDTATTRIAAEEPLLDYTFAALSAVEHVLTDRLAGRPADQAADRATAALAQARTHVATVAPEITGTWGAYDLELTHHFYAAALR